MIRPIACVALLLVFVIAGGCSHQIQAAPEAGVDIGRFTTYHVVAPEPGEVVTAIKNDLTGRGFSVTTGPESATPSNAQCKVIAHDKWMWDITMYLLEVKMEMVDARTGALLASGRCYRTSTVRKSPKVMVKEITDKIYGTDPKSKKDKNAQPAVAAAK
jgi:hypothetical protein